MSLERSGVSLSGHRRSLSDLLAVHRVKRPKRQNEQELREAAVQLLNHHQNLTDLLLEASSVPCKLISNVEVTQSNTCLESSASRPSTCPGDGCWDSPGLKLGGSLIVKALQRQAMELGVPVGVVSAKVAVERVRVLMAHADGHGKGPLLNSTQRAQLSVLLQSFQELLAVGAFSPQLFCSELWKHQERLVLEVVWRLHSGDILTLEHFLESEEGAALWLGTELRALCGHTAAEGTQDDEDEKWQVLCSVVSTLVRAAFQEPQDHSSASQSISHLCRSVLDDTLSWVLDSLQNTRQLQPGPEAVGCWVQVVDRVTRSVFVSDHVLRQFFAHSLTHTLTHRPQLKVSDAVAVQSDWCFAKTGRPLTSLYRKVCVLFGAEELLSHLQQVLETREVNWQHVLSCVSTVLVYDPQAQRGLTELLSRLLTLAFESYDLENMITAFLLARQAALEGPAVFPSYSHWFKMSFGGANCYHGNSKKSLVFLLKFLSDLVPFEQPQYLKVHILHPPYTPAKHRALLQEYTSLAKTRLADLKVSVEEMGLYEDVSGAGPPVEPQSQAQQDVEKAVHLFESTGKISATIMEASIFRRPYFLSRFLPVLLAPRVLPDIPDARMSFIESLRKAEKIPSSMYATYTESCQKERQRQQQAGGEGMVEGQQPLERLQAELKELGTLLCTPGDGEEVFAQLARISETLNVTFTVTVPEQPDEITGHTVVDLSLDPPTLSDVESQVINVILRGFCQSLMDASKLNPPNRQGPWATQFVRMLLGHKRLVVVLLHQLWGLICHQGVTLVAPHILGLSVFLVHLQECRGLCPLVLPDPGHPHPVSFSEALGTALPCSTGAEMSFSLRFCVAFVCYTLCLSESSTERVRECVPSSLCKKLLYLVPRLLSSVRAELAGAGLKSASDGGEEEEDDEDDEEGGNAMWRSITHPSTSWKNSVLALWRQPCLCAMRALPDYQLSFAEWLQIELRVQRSKDALSDPERQEYQQWACQQHYLPTLPDEKGGGRQVQSACSQVLSAILDLHTRAHGPHRSTPASDTCLPDITGRLQEMVFELELTRAFRRAQGDDKDADFLLDVIAERCSVTSDIQAIGAQLELQQLLHTWSRVIVALPTTVLVAVRVQRGSRCLDCTAFMGHINQTHRNVCVPAGRLPFILTAHFYKGLLTSSLCCDHPSQAVNEVLSQMHHQCPLLLLSAGVWWSRLCPVLTSLWSSLTGGPLPHELQHLVDSSAWASSMVRGEEVTPPATHPLLLAACLHHGGRGHRRFRTIRTALWQLKEQHKPVLTYLLFFCATDLLYRLLQSQEDKWVTDARKLCMEVVTCLGDTCDWLLLFQPSSAEQGQYQAASMVTTDRNVKLMPLAFYSLVPHLDVQILRMIARTPRFLLIAVWSYSTLTKLFLDGQTPLHETSPEQASPLHILTKAKQVLLRIISLSSQLHFSQNQIKQLEVACGDLDPEVTSALSSQLDQPRRGHLLCNEPDVL